MLGNKSFWGILSTFLILALIAGACSQPTPMPLQDLPTSTADVEEPTEQVVTEEPAQPTEAPTSEPIPRPTTPPVPAPITGFEAEPLLDQERIDLLQEMGAHWVRRNALFWHRIEAVEGTLDWTAAQNLEIELENISNGGWEVILVIRGAPEWAQQTPGVVCSRIKDEELDAFANFVREAVARYSAPPYNVRYWEIGNEPDVLVEVIPPNSPFGCWGDASDPYFGGAYYTQVLEAVYPAIKAADPDAQVLTGGLLLDCDPVNPPETANGSGVLKDCTSSRYLEGILESGGGDYFDIVSFHGYDYYYGLLGAYGNTNWHSGWKSTGPVLIAKARYLRELLDSYGYTSTPLINTESALLCDGAASMCGSQDFALSKAYYVALANASALAEGLKANVWYSVSGWRNSGLVDSAFQPYPVFTALGFSATELNTATFETEVTQYPGVMGYEFLRDGTRVWLIWSLDAEDHAVQLPSAPTAVYDVFGSPMPSTADLTISVAPLYVEWAP